LEKDAGDHDFEDPEYPEYNKCSLGLVLHNYSKIYGHEECNFISDRFDETKDTEVSKIKNPIVIFDHHIAPGEVIGKRHITLKSVNGVRDYGRVHL
jgi:hypothetical protein